MYKRARYDIKEFMKPNFFGDLIEIFADQDEDRPVIFGSIVKCLENGWLLVKIRSEYRIDGDPDTFEVHENDIRNLTNSCIWASQTEPSLL